LLGSFIASSLFFRSSCSLFRDFLELVFRPD